MDRNVKANTREHLEVMSLSARRAWIEISDLDAIAVQAAKSLSARRAWIEITRWNPSRLTLLVALRKESVDRNVNLGNIATTRTRRSPQGERG